MRNAFNERVVDQLATKLSGAWVGFDADGFRETVNSQLNLLSFSERAALIRDSLWKYLPRDFPGALEIILSALPPEIVEDDLSGYGGFIVMPQNDFVAKYGLSELCG